MPISIQQEPFSSVVPDILPLWEQHYNEVSPDSDKIEMNPDLDSYHSLDKSGHLCVITARDGERLVGYSFFILSSYLHCKQLRVAINDLFYISPEYRGRMGGLKLIRKSDEILANVHNVDQAIMATKVYADFGPILKRAGYRPNETSYRKSLKDI